MYPKLKFLGLSLAQRPERWERHRSVKRVASAVGAGAIVVQLVHEYLAGQLG